MLKGIDQIVEKYQSENVAAENETIITHNPLLKKANQRNITFPKILKLECS